MKIEKFTNKLLGDATFRKNFYNEDDLSFIISEMIIDTRIERGMTQKELARKIGTKQSSIARIENGNSVPSLNFLQRIAKGLNVRLTPPKFNLHINNETISKNFETEELENAEIQILTNTPCDDLFKQPKSKMLENSFNLLT